MSGYEVEAAELFGAAALVEDAAAEGRTELDRLRASARDLLGHGWRGAAAHAFDTGWQEWLEGARLVLAALDDMAQALTITANEYERNEQDLTSGFQRIAVA